MSDRRVWFITGAGRGGGVEFAKAALAAGNAVVGTGRNPDAVRTAVGLAEQKAKDLQEQANAFRDLSTSLALDDAGTS